MKDRLVGIGALLLGSLAVAAPDECQSGQTSRTGFVQEEGASESDPRVIVQSTQAEIGGDNSSEPVKAPVKTGSESPNDLVRQIKPSETTHGTPAILSVEVKPGLNVPIPLGETVAYDSVTREATFSIGRPSVDSFEQRVTSSRRMMYLIPHEEVRDEANIINPRKAKEAVEGTVESPNNGAVLTGKVTDNGGPEGATAKFGNLEAGTRYVLVVKDGEEVTPLLPFFEIVPQK